MTELFEVGNLIYELQYIVEEIAYEANTKPGNGSAFATKLLEAKDSVEKAIAELNEAREMIKKEG